MSRNRYWRVLKKMTDYYQRYHVAASDAEAHDAVCLDAYRDYERGADYEDVAMCVRGHDFNEELMRVRQGCKP